MQGTFAHFNDLYKSPELRLVQAGPGKQLAYHALFGNLAWIDEPLFDWLNKVPLRIHAEDLRSLDPTVMDQLYRSYFLTSAPDEERRELQAWLEARASLIEKGHYLGAIQISTSNVCNFACSYCFADASDRRSDIRQELAKNQPLISFELASQAIRKVQQITRRNGRERIAVKFLGREPLINWPAIRKLLHTFGDEIVWAITTNGSLLTAEVAKELQQFRVIVVVSLDGPPAIHDTMRPTKMGLPTYPVVESGIRNLASAGHPFGISSVVSNVTDFETIPPFMDQLLGWGATELELTLAMQTHDFQAQQAFSDRSPLPKELVSLYQYGTGQGLLIHGDWVDPFHRLLSTHKFRDEPRVVSPAGNGCSATSHQISLEPSGDLFPCRAMGLHYGHLDDLEAVLKSESYRQVVMRTYGNVPFCRHCELEGFCQGTCLGSCEEANQDIYSPQKEYCDVYRETTRLLLRTLKKPFKEVEYEDPQHP